MNLSKDEIRDLKKFGINIEDCKPCVEAKGKELLYVIFISHGNKIKHDSGYPFIRMFGVTSNNEVYDLGWHDHFLSYYPINIDSLGKNIFRLMTWCNKEFKFKVSEAFLPCSTIEFGDMDYTNWNPKERVIR